jgi:hypothetical protein
MNKRFRGKSDTVSIDLTDLVHPSLRVSNHGDNEIKSTMLSGGCILHGYGVFTAYRRKKLHAIR